MCQMFPITEKHTVDAQFENFGTTTQGLQTQKPTSAPHGNPTLRGTISSPERSLCNHRFVVDSGTLCNGEEFLCGTDNSRCENTCKHLGTVTHDAVVHGVGVL